MRTLRMLAPRAAVLLLLIATATGLIAFYARIASTPKPLTASEVDEIVVQAMASATPRGAISAQVYQTILPSLVLVQTERSDADEIEGRGIGSGVIVNADGAVLTALHVVEGAAEIKVTFMDGTVAGAQVIATQPAIDIAVLQPIQSPQVIVPAALGSLSSVRVGDEAYAVGNPFGLPGSMSAGVISGFNRTMEIHEKDQRLTGMIQFDAAVNPGNSGGPLLNRYGQVIGIVTGLANPSEEGVFIGIGLAVPITVAAAAAGAPPY